MRKWILIVALASVAQAQPLPAPKVQPPDATEEVRAREIARLRADLDDLRARLSEAEARAAEDQTMLTEVRALKAEVAALRQQLAEVELAAEQKRALEERAISELLILSRQLAAGDTTGVDVRLRELEDSLGPLARAAIEDARAALQNDDLARVSAYLSDAIYQARQER